ncbi:MAG TPA: thiamine pyrophosphate-binding protein [Gemmatimonadaceae bacterium]|nr:thiamine pyrophosphate-binding protein [Gemmatimonadaceae bacterium]
MRTGADAVVQALSDAGVRHVFGLPGDTGVDLYDALHRDARNLTHVLCRDERHAAIMADVYARCRNQVAVVEVSSGGGATYCVGGLGEPFAASIPLLVISSDIHVGSRNTGALTELDQEKLFSSVAKWVRRVNCADEIPSLVAEALTIAVSGRPAPVALIVPENALAEKTHATAAAGSVTVPGARVPADPATIASVGSALAAAEQPAIVVGGGVHTSQAYAELQSLAERAAIPIATTIQGKGAYPESEPWSLGVVGANGGRPYANAYLERSDFVLFVGTRANATDTNGYCCPPRSTTVAQIDIEADRAGRNYPDGVRIIADAKSALAALVAEVRGTNGRRVHLLRQLEEFRQAWRAQPTAVVPKGTIHPLTVLSMLRNVFGDDALIIADCGTATPYLAAHWETKTAGRRLVMPRGHGAMGYAIPGSVGAALAHPGARIVSITTDGSLGMACGELETIARLGLPITIVQLTNGSYGWIKMLQHLYHDGRYFGVDIQRVDAPQIARGFGVSATRVKSAESLREALEASAQSNGPAFVEVIIPNLTELEPPVAPWMAALSGSGVVRPVY